MPRNPHPNHVDNDIPPWMMVLASVLVILIAIGGWYVSSAVEAKAYNNATGENVRAIDAMFIELRVTNR